MGRFEEAESLLDMFHQFDTPPPGAYHQGEAEYLFAVLRFHQGRLTVKELDHAEQEAIAGRNLLKQHGLAALRAEWELTRSNPVIALEAIEQALAISRRTGLLEVKYLALRALALAKLGRTADARETLAEAKGSLLIAAQACLALDNRDEALELARQAYRAAWADGPPYIHWYSLKRCRELMAELGEPEPQLQPFDPTKVEPIPYEAEILALAEEVKMKALQKRAKEMAHLGGPFIAPS
jgi:tetratricopeptide (TPR) repeat protein